MKKKLVALVLAGLMAGGLLAGCGSSATTATPATADTTETTTAETAGSETATASTGSAVLEAHEDQVYYMVTFMSGYSFWSECWRGYQDAANLLGVTAKYGGSQEYDVNQAVTSLQQIVATKPTAMAVTAMDADAYVDPINEAVDSGIPVVMFDSDSPKSKRTTFLGTSNYDCGVKAAQFIGEQMGGSGTVISMTSPGQTNIYARETGFEETMQSTYPNINIVMVQAGTSETEAAANVGSALTTNPDAQYIFAQTQSCILGAQTALSEAGMSGKVKILGFDTDTTTLDSIDSGDVEATITQSPYCEGFWSLIYDYMLVNQNCISATDGWYEKGYPALPASGDSGSMVVTKDDTYMFRQDATASE